VIRRSSGWGRTEEGEDKDDDGGGRERERGPLSYTHGMDMPFNVWMAPGQVARVLFVVLDA
jgi:hypothetical protein